MDDLAALSRDALIAEVTRLRTQLAQITDASESTPDTRAMAAASATPSDADLLGIITGTARIGFALIDPEHRYRYVNRIYKEIMRLPPDDIAGQFIGDVLGPLYEQMARPSLERAFSGDRISYLTSPPPLPGEEQRYYNVRLEPVGDRTGSFVAVTAIDFTEVVRAEQSLREREAQLRLANEASGIGTWRHDLQSNRVYFDERAQVHFGLADAEVGFETISSQIHPDDLPELMATIAAAINGADDGHFAAEYRVFHPHASPTWVAIKAQVHFVGEGAQRQVPAVFGTSQDITVRKRAEEEIERVSERLRTLHHIDRAILDAHSPEQVATLAIEQMHQLVPYQIAGVMLYEDDWHRLRLLAVSGDTSNVPTLGSTLDFGTPLRIDSWAMHPWRVDDVLASPRMADYLPMLVQMGVRSLLHIPLLSQSRLIGALSLAAPTVGAFTSVHEEIANEIGDQLTIAIQNARLLQQLQNERAELAQRVAERTADLSAANAALARAARLKDEFLANMSHELRTPLNSILGFSEIIEEEIYGPITADQRHAITAIADAGRHLLSLINDILDLAKIESGRVVLDRELVYASDVCNAALRMVSQIALHKSLAISSIIDSRVETIFADERRLKQMLVNLLSNAVKFTPDGGSVGLEVQAEPEHDRIVFTVWDTGIGIAPEDQHRLFKAFVQIDSALNRQSEGTGLGLALVMNLARLHGGSVSLESAPGKGSRFSISLPWSQPAASALALSPEATAAQGAQPAAIGPYSAFPPTAAGPEDRPLVLLAEDNTINSNLLADYLQRAGYRVLEACNGSEAVAFAQAHQPDLILMDIQMPGLDGTEAIRRIRASGMLDIPIIALTALAMPGDEDRCLAAGASGYMAKPVSLRRLRAIIAEKLAGVG